MAHLAVVPPGDHDGSGTSTMQMDDMILVSIDDHAGGLLDRRIEAFGSKVEDRPSDIFKEKVYVSPFPEEDVVGLTELIGAVRMLFGSDWPHPEGNIQLADYVDCLQKLDAADVKRIMRDNALSLAVTDG